MITQVRQLIANYKLLDPPDNAATEVQADNSSQEAEKIVDDPNS